MVRMPVLTEQHRAELRRDRLKTYYTLKGIEVLKKNESWRTLKNDKIEKWKVVKWIMNVSIL